LLDEKPAAPATEASHQTPSGVLGVLLGALVGARCLPGWEEEEVAAGRNSEEDTTSRQVATAAAEDRMKHNIATHRS
jgi:hypothetical protein